MIINGHIIKDICSRFGEATFYADNRQKYSSSSLRISSNSKCFPNGIFIENQESSWKERQRHCLSWVSLTFQ